MTTSQIIVMALLVVGGLISAVGNIMLIVAAFKESIAWGIAVALFPLVGLFFVILHFAQAKKAFQIQMLGTSFVFLAVGAAVATGVRDASAWVQCREEAIDDGDYSEYGDGLPVSADAGGWRQEITPSAPKPDSSADSAVASRAGRSPAAGEFVGMTLEQVRASRGDPKGVMETDGTIIWLYDRLEVISADGVNVTGESRK